MGTPSFGATFKECQNLSDISNVTFDLSGTSELWESFKNCSKLTNINITNLQYINSMYSAFEGCTNLQSLNLGSLNTSIVDQSTGFLDGVPNNCNITINNIQDYLWLTNRYPNLTNITMLNPANIYNINIIDKVDQLQPLTQGYETVTYKLNPIDDLKIVNSFQLNYSPEITYGNSFVLGRSDVTIDNIEIIEKNIWESNHNPYQDSEDYTILDTTISDAKNLKLLIQLASEEGCDYLDIIDGEGQSRRYTGVYDSDYNPEPQELIINGNYINMHWHTDSSVHNYYGYRVELIKLDENYNPINNNPINNN